MVRSARLDEPALPAAGRPAGVPVGLLARPARLRSLGRARRAQPAQHQHARAALVRRGDRAARPVGDLARAGAAQDDRDPRRARGRRGDDGRRAVRDPRPGRHRRAALARRQPDLAGVPVGCRRRHRQPPRPHRRQLQRPDLPNAGAAPLVRAQLRRRRLVHVARLRRPPHPRRQVPALRRRHQAARRRVPDPQRPEVAAVEAQHARLRQLRQGRPADQGPARRLPRDRGRRGAREDPTGGANDDPRRAAAADRDRPARLHGPARLALVQGAGPGHHDPGPAARRAGDAVRPRLR